MKTKKYTLLLFATILILSACTSSEDEIEMQGIHKNELDQDELDQDELERVPFMWQALNSNLNDTNLFKSENNEKGVKIVAFYSNAGNWYGDFPIYDENGILIQFLTILFPQNGVDRALVFNETDMMVNFTSHDPKMFIWNVSTGLVVYSNWCEDDRNGLYKGRGKTGYINPEWAPEAYFWGPFAPVEGDDNYNFMIKGTLYPASGYIYEPGGVCKYFPTSESVEINYMLVGQNGKIKQTFDMR